ncbi:MAG: RNA-binding transcriptional accessory protein, partial [Clostridia bacterium]|nr:RNA-binding transcriptional accessory protein [Clostridia bacterium]
MDLVNKIIADELNINESQVEATVKLIDGGNTIPFIARYRKEVTGGLSDEILRDLGERLNYLRNLETRKEEVKKIIEEQGKLTDEIVKALERAKILAEVEDIYRPYKQKKRTRATIAKEKGLEPLAKIIFEQIDNRLVEVIATEFINEEKEVSSVEDAILGAKDIIAENISDNADYRKEIKRIYYRDGIVETRAVNEEEKSSYEMYYNFSEKVNRIPSHRILAINRGESENFIKVKIDKPEDIILKNIQKDII